MAKKSKTQRAKASAARQAKKAQRENVEQLDKVQSDSTIEDSKKSILGKKADDDKSDSSKKASDASVKNYPKKSSEKPKKQHFKFLHDVRGELKRVTWPSRVDVLRWTGVVVAALVFFGIFVAVLDNVIITPLLVLISGI